MLLFQAAMPPRHADTYYLRAIIDATPQMPRRTCIRAGVVCEKIVLVGHADADFHFSLRHFLPLLMAYVTAAHRVTYAALLIFDMICRHAMLIFSLYAARQLR